MLNRLSARRRAAVAWAVAETLETRAYFTSLTFATPIAVPLAGASGTAGQFASSVAAQFGTNGLTDIATLDATDHTLDILLNNGNGSYSLAQSLSTGREPGSLQAVALTNGDVDLIFVNSIDGTVEYYTGNGNGTFSTTPTNIQFATAQPAGFTGTVTPDTVAAVDVNGDGLPDIVVGTSNDDLFTFLNQGNNGFALTQDTAGELDSSGIFVTGQSTSDIVGGLPDGTIQLFADNGSGLAVISTMQAVPGSLADSSVYRLASNVVTGDFNNDGNLDVAAVITDSQTQISYTSVLLGNGNGTFEPAVLTPIPIGVTQLQVSSFSSSGNEDLLAEYSDHTTVFTGNGNGAFTDQDLTIPETGWTSAAIGDFNGDGLVDAAFGNSLVLNTAGLKATTTAISATANPIAPGQQVTLKAAVTAASGAPTGNVAFFDNTNPVEAKLLGVGKLTGGAASINVNLGNTTEVHKIVAEYVGSSSFATSPSSSLSESVLPGAGIPTGPTILTPTITKDTVPSAAPANTKLTNASLSVKLTNSSGTNAKGPVIINVYASATTTLDASTDTLVAQITKTETLKVGKTTSFSIPIKSLPSVLIGGTYHLIVETFDSAGTASAASTATTSVAAPFISLPETIKSLKLPTTIVSGGTLKASSIDLAIVNEGNVTDDGFTINLTADPVGQIGGSSFLTVKKSTKIAPGKSISLLIPLKVLPTLAAGDYDLIAQATNSDGGSTLAASPFTVS